MSNGVRVCSIERGSTLDGTGIRYVIFTTSCPFRCKFCHNPESWYAPNSFPFMTVEELLKNVKRFKNFLKNGGVTVSGGEPTLHKDFLLEFFTGLKEMGIHTAIDTCGYTDIDEKMEKIVELCDLFLVDIKHVYEAEHIELTGKTKKKTLELLRYLTAKKKSIIIRVVMHSADVNTEEYASKVALYLHRFKTSIEFVELLPYHSMGAEKWRELRLHYDESAFQTPSQEQVRKFARVLERAGYKTKY